MSRALAPGRGGYKARLFREWHSQAQLGNEGQEEELGMGVPQVILMMILGAGVGVGLIKHGEPRQGNHSFPIAVAAVVIECALLYWGGFFG